MARWNRRGPLTPVPCPVTPIFCLFILTQTCFLMSVNVIGQRMDFYAMIHACWLIAVLYRRRRKAIAEIWPKYCCFLACILSFQYLICIGFPPAPCRGEWNPLGDGGDQGHPQGHPDPALSVPCRLPLEVQGRQLQRQHREVALLPGLHCAAQPRVPRV